MTEQKIKNTLTKYFEYFFFEKVTTIKKIKGGVSERLVYKIKSKNYICIGIYNPKIKENIAFIEFSKSLKSIGINVPEIYYISDSFDFYLEEFLGDKSLYNIIINHNFPKENKLKLFKNALSDLANIQINGDKVIKYKYCCETKIFDKKQIIFDFKKFYNYYLQKFTNLKLSNSKISFIIKEILNNLSSNDKLFFMYRDFQPRNIMIKDNSLYYIDYQSGRKGHLQYDVASFLYSGSINLTEKERNALLNHYIKEINKLIKINSNKFKSSFYYFAFIRLLQILGSYGYVYQKRKEKNIIVKINKALLNLKSIKNKIANKNLQSFIKDIIKSKVRHRI